MTTPVHEAARESATSVTIEVETICACMYCPECSIGTHTDVCEDCSGPTKPLNDCSGCYQDAHDAVQDLWQAWVAANPSLTGQYRIDGSNMGWRHLSGWLDVDEDVDLVDAIAVNSDWRQTWTIDPVMGGRCEASQSHHDAMGEHYVVAVPSNEGDHPFEVCGAVTVATGPAA